MINVKRDFGTWSSRLQCEVCKMVVIIGIVTISAKKKFCKGHSVSTNYQQIRYNHYLLASLQDDQEKISLRKKQLILSMIS